MSFQSPFVASLLAQVAIEESVYAKKQPPPSLPFPYHHLPVIVCLPFWSPPFCCSQCAFAYDLFFPEEAAATIICICVCVSSSDRIDGVMRTMNTEKLIKTLPIIQNQLDALLDFQVFSVLCCVARCKVAHQHSARVPPPLLMSSVKRQLFAEFEASTILCEYESRL